MPSSALPPELGPKYAVAALFGVALVVIVLARPVIGAYTLVAVVPPVSGLRAGLPVPQFRLSEVLVASVGVLLLLIARPGQTPRWRAFDWLALGYAVANAVLGAGDLLARGSPISIANADKLLGPLQFFLLYRAVLATLTTQRQRQAALRLMLFASVPVSLLAILQEIHAPGIVNFLANITDSQAFPTNVGVARATGPFALWHDLGSYLFVIVMLGVALLINQSWRVIKPRMLAAIVVLAARRAALHGELHADRGHRGRRAGASGYRPTAQTVDGPHRRAHRAPRGRVRTDPGQSLSAAVRSPGPDQADPLPAPEL